jgi:hypothetical protein
MSSFAKGQTIKIKSLEQLLAEGWTENFGANAYYLTYVYDDSVYDIPKVLCGRIGRISEEIDISSLVEFEVEYPTRFGEVSKKWQHYSVSTKEHLDYFSLITDKAGNNAQKRHACLCHIHDLMNHGCKCGGV